MNGVCSVLHLPVARIENSLPMATSVTIAAIVPMQLAPRQLVPIQLAGKLVPHDHSDKLCVFHRRAFLGHHV